MNKNKAGTWKLWNDVGAHGPKVAQPHRPGSSQVKMPNASPAMSPLDGTLSRAWQMAKLGQMVSFRDAKRLLRPFMSCAFILSCAHSLTANKWENLFWWTGTSWNLDWVMLNLYVFKIYQNMLHQNQIVETWSKTAAPCWSLCRIENPDSVDVPMPGPAFHTLMYLPFLPLHLGTWHFAIRMHPGGFRGLRKLRKHPLTASTWLKRKGSGEVCLCLRQSYCMFKSKCHKFSPFAHAFLKFATVGGRAGCSCSDKNVSMAMHYEPRASKAAVAPAWPTGLFAKDQLRACEHTRKRPSLLQKSS